MCADFPFIPTNVGIVDFSGYVLIAITVLLVLYVIPHMHRRRSVLAEARIEERFAEDLRMLDVGASRKGGASVHTGGPHGTVFFRQPEVIMKKSEHARGNDDVRVIAKERARRRARISQRNVNKQRGILGGAVIGIATIVFWVLAGVTGLALAVPAVSTAVLAAYGIGFGYIVKTMAEATAADEAAIEKLNVKLRSFKGSAHVAGSRRPAVPHRPGRASSGQGTRGAKAPAASAQSSAAAAAESEQTEAVEARRVDAVTGADVKTKAPSKKNTSAVQVSCEAGGDEVVRHEVVRDEVVRNEGSKISISVEPEIVEDTIAADLSLTAGGTDSAATQSNPGAADTGSGFSVSSSGEVTSREAVSAPSSSSRQIQKPTSASVADSGNVAANAARSSESVKEDSAGSVAHGTARVEPEPIKREVLTPYEAPAVPTAAVPYRPKDLDEHFEENSLTPARSADEAQGLSGGSALDALLDRRRA